VSPPPPRSSPKQIKAYNEKVYQAIANDDEKAMVSAIQDLEVWSETFTEPEKRRAMAQAVWHAAHESVRMGGSASAAFHAFRPEIFDQIANPQPLPAREIIILGTHTRTSWAGRGLRPLTGRGRSGSGSCWRTIPTPTARPRSGWRPTSWTGRASLLGASAIYPRTRRAGRATTWPIYTGR
jgi:hypothetical protein